MKQKTRTVCVIPKGPKTYRLTMPVPTENQVQGAFFKWARNYGVREFPELKWLHHIPNGGARDAITGAILKRQGVTPGILDTCLPVARKGFHGLYIEIKKPGQTMTPEQIEFTVFLIEQGYAAHCVDNWQRAIDLVREYLHEPACDDPMH